MDSGGISAVIFAILFLVVSAAFTHKLWVEGALTTVSPNSGLDFLSLMVLYLPNTLFAYGFIADLMNSNYHYSVAGITGLVGMLINKVAGEPFVDGLSFLGGQIARLPVAAQAAIGVGAVAAAAAVAPLAAAAAPAAFAAPAAPAALAANSSALAALGIPVAAAAAPAVVDAGEADNPFRGGRKQRGGRTNMCALPGFEWLENTAAPQGIVLSMTVLWYLMIELWDTGKASQSIALGATTGGVFLAQSLMMYKNNCFGPYKYGMYSTVVSLLMGITFASSSYFIQKAFGGSAGSVAPTQTNFGPKCPDGTVLNSRATMCVPAIPGKSVSKAIAVGAPSDTSAPVNDDDQFVCEAYKDGELVTSTIVE